MAKTQSAYLLCVAISMHCLLWAQEVNPANEKAPTPGVSKHREPIRKKVSYIIAGGENIELDFLNNWQAPVDNQFFSATSPDFLIDGSKEDPHKPVLNWLFMLRRKDNVDIKRILIEEVYPSKTAITYVDDSSPKFNSKNYWSGSSKPIAFSKSDIPWFFSSDNIIHIFRISITVDDTKFIAYQMESSTSFLRSTFIAMADNVRKTGKILN